MLGRKGGGAGAPFERARGESCREVWRAARVGPQAARHDAGWLSPGGLAPCKHGGQQVGAHAVPVDPHRRLCIRELGPLAIGHGAKLARCALVLLVHKVCEEPARALWRPEQPFRLALCEALLLHASRSCSLLVAAVVPLRLALLVALPLQALFGECLVDLAQRCSDPTLVQLDQQLIGLILCVKPLE